MIILHSLGRDRQIPDLGSKTSAENGDLTIPWERK